MEQQNGKQYKILFVCNNTGSRLWRILPVSQYLQTKGYITHIIDSDQGINPSIIDQFDLIVLQMVFDRRLIKYIRSKGKKAIFEMDDLITWVPADHYAKAEMKKQGWRWMVECWRAIRSCDAVTLTNPYMKRYYSLLRLGKRPADILPNYMHMKFWLRKNRKNVTDRIRIGYVGGSSHKDDLKILINPLKRIMEEHPNVDFVTMGTGGHSSPDDIMQEYNHGTDIFKELPLGRRHHYLGTQMMDYPEKLRVLDIDIGVAPLCENRFTKSKTPIKWMEYASIEAPSVCQGFLYKQVVNHGVNGFLANTEEEYYHYLKQLVEDAELRKKMGQQAYKDLKTHHLFEPHAYKWEQIYKQVLTS